MDALHENIAAYPHSGQRTVRPGRRGRAGRRPALDMRGASEKGKGAPHRGGVPSRRHRLGRWRPGDRQANEDPGRWPRRWPIGARPRARTSLCQDLRDRGATRAPASTRRTIRPTPRPHDQERFRLDGGEPRAHPGRVVEPLRGRRRRRRSRPTPSPAFSSPASEAIPGGGAPGCSPWTDIVDRAASGASSAVRAALARSRMFARGLSKRFGGFTALDHVELAVQPRRVCLLSARRVAARPPCCGRSPASTAQDTDDRVRRRDVSRPAARAARFRHRLPVLRAVSAPDGRRRTSATAL